MTTRSRLIADLDMTFERLVTMITSLDDARLQVPFHPGINPPVWEGGHAAFFFEVFLLRPWNISGPLMPGMDSVWDSFVIDHEDRWVPGMVPPKEATLDYMRRVHEAVRECAETRELTPEDVYLYRYAMFHQCMHIESMIWARQTLGYPPPPFPLVPASAPAGSDVPPGDATIPVGRYWIGMPAGSPDFATADFAFDNEKPEFEVELPAFRISRTLVSNRQFLEFVEDGGYAAESLWSWGGRKWLRTGARTDRDITREAASHSPMCPMYWKREDGGWWMRQFDRWQPLPLDAPVLHVSWWEAEAWCNWAGRRLPTECEWEIAALGRSDRAARLPYPWGATMDERCADLDARMLGRAPVTAYPAGDSPFGCRQMLGTAWEWTSSQFFPYDGFAVDMYPFMSTLQFGTHKTTRGGSFATSAGLIRGTYRQAYLPHRRDAFVGFRTCPREP